MQRNGIIRTIIPHLVDTKVVIYVSHLILDMHLLRYHGHISLVIRRSRLVRKLIASLRELTVKNFHQTVCVTVAMYEATFARRPDKQKLLRQPLNDHIAAGSKLTRLLFPLP
jgi:hypothetical protein